ncbi:MAG: asparagine synthase (glutamine-hydrolyzing) [bacterium]|nr:asparagine synthase (glutamine-hydrolyzing) [bacterium]
MCGIAGIIDLEGAPVQEVELRRMMESLTHRGPDDEGVFTRKGIGFGHKRLSIIDLTGGAQPFINESAGLVVVQNGEIYNYKEIRREIGEHYSFETNSDTEVILAAYHKWGIEGIHKFRGMFAFALYDMRRERVYLVRDRVGIKPLYYYRDDRLIVFASQLTALVQSGRVEPRISPVGLSGYLRYQYVPAPHSIYNNIYKLEPGHFLMIDLSNGKVEKDKYWDLRIETVPRGEDEALEELNELLDDTLNIYLRSDVPFGAFLSGGTDSSIVTALMEKHLDNPVQSFSIGFEEEEFSELAYAAEAGKTVHADHTERVLSSGLSLDLLQTIVRHFGEPFCDSSAIPTYYVSQLAREKVKMVLSGDGGDELFAGYRSYPEVYRHYYGDAKSSTPVREVHDRRREIFREGEIRKLMGSADDLFTSRWSYAGNGSDPVACFQLQDFKTYLVDDVLTKVDRMSMAHSLEVRVPLLDHKIVEFAFTLPLDLRIRKLDEKTGPNDAAGLITKYLLKKSASRFFPFSFLDRRKMGFGIPVYPWMQGEFREAIEGELRDPGNGIFQWLDYEYVRRLVDEYYLENRRGLTARIWSLFIFSLWMHSG